MVELNAAGWTAVLAPGAVFGVLVGVLTRKPTGVCAFLGAVASWSVALVMDAKRWRTSEITMVVPDDFSPNERTQLLSALELERVDATVAEVADPDTGEFRWHLVTTMQFRDVAERYVYRSSLSARVSEIERG